MLPNILSTLLDLLLGGLYCLFWLLVGLWALFCALWPFLAVWAAATEHAYWNHPRDSGR